MGVHLRVGGGYKILHTTLSDWRLGDERKIEFEITTESIDSFANLTGDYNPLHVSVEYAQKTDFEKPVAHGMLTGSKISTLIGMHLPGPGALWTSHNISFIRPAFVGDHICLKGVITHISHSTSSLQIEITATNQHSQEIIKGQAVVKLLPTRKQKKIEMKQKNYLIIGASSGVGTSVIEQLKRDDVQIIGTYNQNKPAYDEPNLRWIKCNLLSIDEIQLAKEKIKNSGLKFSGVVQLASKQPDPKTILQADWGDYNEQLQINVGALLDFCKFLLDENLLDENASIVAMSSIYTLGKPPSSQSSYITAKYALNGLCKTMAVDLGPKGIRVNIVSAGMIHTKMISSVPEKIKLQTKMATPLRKLAEPEDVASAINFLLSDASIHITGENLNVSGGWEM